MKNNKTCILCGKAYRYCQGCAEFVHLEPWHNIYHDNNCRVIFNTVTDYCAGILSKEEAIAILDKCNLSEKDSFNKNVLKVLEELYPTVEEIVINGGINIENEAVILQNKSVTTTTSTQKSSSYSQTTYKKNKNKNKNKK